MVARSLEKRGTLR